MYPGAELMVPWSAILQDRIRHVISRLVIVPMTSQPNCFRRLRMA